METDNHIHIYRFLFKMVNFFHQECYIYGCIDNDAVMSYKKVEDDGNK